ncbi:MAG: class I SAM-dependent methyltransferase [Bacteroidia bacterium]|nr:class I SAM-dependent methyltransferase [Bacteroidia bacterium]
MGGQSVSLAQVRRSAIERLKAVYPAYEAEALCRALLSHVFPEWRFAWLDSGGRKPFPPALLPQWEAALRRLLHQEPLAYITGRVVFAEMELYLPSGVFIPRPETEAWAYALRNLLRRPPKTILDIGTGSGALALFLARGFPEATVYAIDKSPLAVLTARKNASLLQTRIRVERVAFGKEALPPDFPAQWDLIVSNPPYVPWSRYAETSDNVRLYEPPDAIFCSDTYLYEAMAIFAEQSLSEEGAVAIELFPPDALTIATLWQSRGFSTVLNRDGGGHLRWMLARRI